MQWIQGRSIATDREVSLRGDQRHCGNNLLSHLLPFWGRHRLDHGREVRGSAAALEPHSLTTARFHRYSFTDFALAGAMHGDEELPEHRSSYDVLCIYIKQMLERWGVYFPELVPIIAKMLCCISSFHIHSHHDLCQAVFSMCYAISWGLLHMETIEHPWARLNKAAAPLREMTGGARHDAYNDLFNFWNREKLERMGERL